jgi:hypothetical protein
MHLVAMTDITRTETPRWIDDLPANHRQVCGTEAALPGDTKGAPMKHILNLGSSILLLALLVTSAATIGGCSTATLPAARAPNALDIASGWSFERPGQGVEAFGLPQHARAVPSAVADVAPYLQAPRPVTSTRKVAAMASAKVVAPDNAQATPALGNAQATPKPTPLPAAAKAEEAPQASLLAANTTTDAEQRYAARDRAAQEQKEFRGGDVIVITTGTIVLALLILLLVLLVT